MSEIRIGPGDQSHCDCYWCDEPDGVRYPFVIFLEKLRPGVEPMPPSSDSSSMNSGHPSPENVQDCLNHLQAVMACFDKQLKVALEDDAATLELASAHLQLVIDLVEGLEAS